MLDALDPTEKMIIRTKKNMVLLFNGNWKVDSLQCTITEDKTSFTQPHITC